MGPVEGRGTREALRDTGVHEFVIVEQALDGRCERGRVGRLRQQHGVAAHFGQCSRVGRHHRHAGSHGLEDREAEPLFERRLNQQPSAGIERLSFSRRDVAQVRHEAFQWSAVNSFEPRSRLLGGLAGQYQARQVRTATGEHRPGIQQGADVLARFEGAKEEHVAVFRLDRPRRPCGATRRTDTDAVGGHVKQALDLAGGELRHHDDPVGAVRMRARQRRVVAAHFGSGPLGMPQEVQVVDGHHLRGGAGRQQQWVQRVRDVERAASHHLGRWPPQAVPCQIEQPDGNLTVDQMGSGKVWVREDTVPG